MIHKKQWLVMELLADLPISVMGATGKLSKA
jgi:hypothetical protein